jgi:hypothetical protein
MKSRFSPVNDGESAEAFAARFDLGYRQTVVNEQKTWRNGTSAPPDQRSRGAIRIRVF